VRDELNAYHRRSSHTGAASLHSSSIYALLNFESSPENGCTDCINSDVDSLTIPLDRLRSVYCNDGVHICENVEYHHEQGTSNEADRTSVSGLSSAEPSQYIDRLSSTGGKKQLVVSLPDADTSTCTQSKTSDNNSLPLKDKRYLCNGLTSLLSVDNDDAVLPSNGDKVLLRHDAARAKQCPEVNHRRYSCGDQLAATWWRLLDHAASFSDLRVLPRSLSRFCCSTWRTFTGVKSPCIDVSKVGSVGPLQSSENSALNINGLNTCIRDEVVKQSINQWWHKPVSPDRRRLIEINSDVESNCLCDNSPRKVDCSRVFDNAQNLCETVADSQLSDSDGGGSYVSLRVNCNSSVCHRVLHSTPRSESVLRCCHADCDMLDEDDHLCSVMELPTKQTVNLQKDAQIQTTDTHALSPMTSVLNSGWSVDFSQSSLSSTTCSCVTGSSTHCGPAVLPCRHSSHLGSCSLKQSEHLLQPNNGYVNLSLGIQSSSLDRQSATCISNSSLSNDEQPANISAQTRLVPNVGNDSTVPLDKLAVHVPCSVRKERLSCDDSSFSNESPIHKLSRKSSNHLLRLIRRSSTKAHKQSVLPAECDVNNTHSPTDDLTDSVAVTVNSSAAGNDQPQNVRLPSPSVPPPPVPDDYTTSRLFRLCHTSSSERMPINVTINSDQLTLYEEPSSLKTFTAAKNNSTLSSSYSAGDRQHYESQSLKSSINEDSIKLSAKMPSHRHRHGWFYCILH